MTPENFVYWLQGMLEISKATTLNEEQVTVIKDHIALVLSKITPDRITISPMTTSPWFGIVPPNNAPPLDNYPTCCHSTNSNPSVNYAIESTC